MKSALPGAQNNSFWSVDMERLEQYDVAIAGGGTAGCAAAIGAVQAGAKTVLIERNSYLGGEATHSGVGAFCGFTTCGKHPVRVVEGAGSLVLEALKELGAPAQNRLSASGNWNISFEPEYLKCALDALLDRLHVEVLLHAQLAGADVEENQICRIRCMDDEGVFTVQAKTFVDASGDANLARLAGARVKWGGLDGHVQAASLPFRLSGVDITKDMSPAAVGRAVELARADGMKHLVRESGFLLTREGSDVVCALIPSVMPTGLSARELTRMEKELRKQAVSYAAAMKRYMPGMEHSELVMTGPSIGFRETRKLVGRTMLTGEDVLSGRKRPDGIARGGWKPEIHKDIRQMATYLEVKEGNWFDIPLGALQSETLENLYGAGRMIWADDTAFAAVRVMGTCFATGHAAGVAAALQAKDRAVAELRANEHVAAALQTADSMAAPLQAKTAEADFAGAVRRELLKQGALI